MTKNYPGEQWKTLQFNFEFTNDCRLDVSNFGRIRTFNVVSDGNILKGSMINGYRIIRLKLYKPRDEKKDAYFKSLQNQSISLARQIKVLNQNPKTVHKVDEASKLLAGFRKDLSKKFAQDLKSRTINYHSLVHRLVAEYFCIKPSEAHTMWVI